MSALRNPAFTLRRVAVHSIPQPLAQGQGTPPPRQSCPLLSCRHISTAETILPCGSDFLPCCTAFDGSRGLWDQAQSFTELSRASTIQHHLPFPAELPFSSSDLQTLRFPVSVPLLTLVPSRQVSSHTDHNDSSSRDPAEAILPLPIRSSLTLQTVGTFDPGLPSAPCLQSLWTSHRSMTETISDGCLHTRVYQPGTCALWMLHTLGRIGVAKTQPGTEVPTNAGLCVLFQSLPRLIHTLTDFTPRRSCEAGTITTPVFQMRTLRLGGPPEATELVAELG